MNSPYVSALIYEIKHGDAVNYSKTEPFFWEGPEFRVTIRNIKEVRFEFKRDYTTEEDAQDSISDFINTWEFDACLRNGPDYFRLEYVGAQMKDRMPTPHVVELSSTLKISMINSSAALVVKPRQYSPPPSGVVFDFNNSIVKKMYRRYMKYRRGYELLASMAYFCLNVLENSMCTENTSKVQKRTRRSRAAQKFDIPKNTLDKIAKLSSTKGGEDARKADGVATELSEEDCIFLDNEIKKMIYQAAIKTHGFSG